MIEQIKKVLFDDEMIKKLVDIAMERQHKENPVLPMMKKQLAETEKGIRNFVDAIQQGSSTRLGSIRISPI